MKYNTKPQNYCEIKVAEKDLIKSRVQGEEFSVAVGLALVFVVPIDVLVGSTVKKVGQKRIGKGILQVKNAAGPAAPRSIIYRHRPPLQIILEN